jgi:hypothetical protein
MKNRSFACSLLLVFTTAIASAITQPPSKSPLFSSDSVVQLELAADFDKLKYLAKSGVSDRQELESDPKYMVPMVLSDSSHPERIFKAQARGRGHSSLEVGDEVDFPKLKIEIEDAEDLAGTLFAGARNFRVNTHLSTNPESESSRMGRVYGDAGPMREGLAYRLAETLGLKTPATRLARIRYKDLGTHTEFTRNALLIETNKKIAERLGGKAVNKDDLSNSEISGINPVEGALFFLFHQMIGNNDFALRVNQPVSESGKYLALFNTVVFELPDNSRVPVVYDLDLAKMVKGKKPYADDVPYELELLKESFTPEQLAQAIAITKAHKAALYETVQRTPVDKTGRELALQYLDIFFAKIDSVLH